MPWRPAAQRYTHRMSTDQTLGFAIVGCGMIARFHVRALADVPGTRIAALVTRNPASAEKLHRRDRPAGRPDLHRPGRCARSDRTCTSSSSPRRAGPTWSRPSPRPRPASTSSSKSRWRSRPSGATGSSRRATATGSSSAPSSRRDSHDANVTLKQAVDAGRFGRLTLGETTCKWWRSQAYYDEGGWKGTQALDGGGALMNQAIHNVDLLLWMMGDATHVTGFTATLAHERIEVEDTAVACLTFKNGALGVIQATTSVFPACPRRSPSTATRARPSSSRRTCCAGSSTPETPEDAQVKARFAQKVGASGGSSDPKAISHAGPRPAARRLRPGDPDEHRARWWTAARGEGRRPHLRDLRVDADRQGGRPVTMAKKPRNRWSTSPSTPRRPRSSSASPGRAAA